MSPGYFSSSTAEQERVREIPETEETKFKPKRCGKKKEREREKKTHFMLCPFCPLAFQVFRSERFPPSLFAAEERKEFTCDLPRLRWGLIKKDEKRCHTLVDYSAPHLPRGSVTSQPVWWLSFSCLLTPDGPSRWTDWWVWIIKW